MIEAEEHNSFFFGDKKIKNLKQLVETLEDENHIETAKRHISENNNDFANWIRHVLKDGILADRISKESDVRTIAKIIKENISYTETPVQDKESIKHETGIIDHSDPAMYDMRKNENEKMHSDSSELHLKTKITHHDDVLKKSKETRHFCPLFFDCMKKEFLFGLGLGIIVGIFVAVFIKIGAI